METLIMETSRLLGGTLGPDKAIVDAATDGLGRLSHHPHFPLVLLAVATGGDSKGLRIAAAAYLKNFLRQHTEGKTVSLELHKEFRNQLAQALLQVEPAVLKVLVEAFRVIITNDFVKDNSWPELVHELKSAIQSSNLLGGSGNFKWNTINVLTVLQTVLRPFQYFLNPKVSREPVPSQLELIAKEILVPLQATFHHFVDKVLTVRDKVQVESEQVLLIICKCINFTVRSYMPCALSPVLPSFCQDFFRILDPLSLEGVSDGDGYSLRLKTAKRSLIIFCSLVTRHRKHVDKLMPSIINCAFKISKQSSNISNMDFLSERIISLAFDVISHVLETGPGWRYVSPHFSSLLDSAIFPALTMNQKDISEWEEDADEYIRKNLPSDLDEISGWAEDLFTARKSAINLLGVISMSKGPRVMPAASKRKKGDKLKGKMQSSVGELVVMPFLLKFPMPSDGGIKPSRIVHEYYGVLMAYGGLQDFLRERSPEYTSTLIQNRVLPLYSLYPWPPYLIATANWVLGELASCLPQTVSADVYSSLMGALTMADIENINCYPVRASAAGAIAELLENDYVPPDWLPLLQVLVERMVGGNENESFLLFELLGSVVEAGQEKVAVHIPIIVSRVAVAISKHIPPIPEPWPKVVEHGFAALAVMAHTWEDSIPDEVNRFQNTEWRSGWAAIAGTFSSLLQQAWLMSMQPMDGAVSCMLPPPSCIDDSSALLGTIMRFITSMDEANELKIVKLLAVWASLIADWHAWEEVEDLPVFSSIREAVHLHRRCDLVEFFMRTPSRNFFASTPCSIVEGIAAFVTEAITAYPSATWRAFSCAHILLHIPRFSPETEGVKQLMAVSFTRAAFSRYREIRIKPSGLWKPLLLVISSCYISYPENIEQLLEKEEDDGFTVWAHGLAHISSSSSEPLLSSESEIILAAIALSKVVERLIGTPSDRRCALLQDCFVSLMEVCKHLKEVQDEGSNNTEDADYAASDVELDDVDGDEEDSEDGEQEETEEEFLDRYAKAAEDLENEMVEEGDVEDVEQELELGDLDEVDVQKTLGSLIERHHQVLLQGQTLPSSLIQGMLCTFPEYGSFFHSC